MHTSDHRPDLLMSAHGRRRAAARGSRSTVLANLVDIADREVPAGGGCVALWASTRAITSARREGLAPDEIERLKGRVLVLDPEGGVITALVMHRRRGRHYRRKGRRGAQSTRRNFAGRRR